MSVHIRGNARNVATMRVFRFLQIDASAVLYAAELVMAYVVMAHVVMAHVVMAYIVMVYFVMTVMAYGAVFSRRRTRVSVI